MKQLGLFDDADHAPVSPTEETAEDPVFDTLMAKLELLNKQAEDSNKLLQEMIDDLQKDWSEDEKLQIRDPKEWQKQQELKKKEENISMAKELTQEAIETLKNSKVEGLVVKLPEGQLERKTYLEVKDRLELIGGKWRGGKISGFVFQECPKELLEQIAKGERRDLKKEFQFFATPDHLADTLVKLAFDGKDPNGDILEPSAGQGAIIKAIRKVTSLTVFAYEAMPLNQTVLKKLDRVELLGDDFLKHSEGKFNYVIANPPFSKNQDIDHVYKMYEVLSPGGRLVSITSKHWQIGSNKKESQFKQWLEKVDAEVIEVDAGEFKESGTNIATVILVIDK